MTPNKTPPFLTQFHNLAKRPILKRGPLISSSKELDEWDADWRWDHEEDPKGTYDEIGPRGR